jgi:hypothetical protein
MLEKQMGADKRWLMLKNQMGAKEKRRPMLIKQIRPMPRDN